MYFYYNMQFNKAWAIQEGGDLPYLDDNSQINFFEDEEMEKYLNPIYGAVIHLSGFIKNHYYLHLLLTKTSSELGESNLKYKAHFVYRSTTFVNDKFRPTEKLFDTKNEINTYKLGIYLGFKYFSMKNDKFISINKNKQIVINSLYDISEKKTMIILNNNKWKFTFLP